MMAPVYSRRLEQALLALEQLRGALRLMHDAEPAVRGEASAAASLSVIRAQTLIETVLEGVTRRGVGE
jgi:hypothetical protein